MKVYTSVSDPDLVKASLQSIEEERARMERLVRNRAILAPIALIAGSCGMALYFSGRSSSGWWGNPQYGPAGVLLACGVALVIFYWHAFLVYAGRCPIFHRTPCFKRRSSQAILTPDGCNGFGS